MNIDKFVEACNTGYYLAEEFSRELMLYSDENKFLKLKNLINKIKTNRLENNDKINYKLLDHYFYNYSETMTCFINLVKKDFNQKFENEEDEKMRKMISDGVLYVAQALNHMKTIYGHSKKDHNK